MKIDQIELGKYYKILAKGDNGTGKSIFASSFPDPYIFFFEPRWEPLLSYWKYKMKQERKDIDFDYFTSLYQINQKLDELLGRPVKKTIVFDSLTSLADRILSHLLVAKGDEGDKREGKKTGGIPLNTIEDFGGEDSELKILRDKCLSYPGHVIWTAHVISIENRDLKGNSFTSRQLITGGKKAAAKIPGYFNEVYHFSLENGRYTFITKNQGIEPAKTSLPIKEKFDFTDNNAYDLLVADLKENQTKLDEAIKKESDIRARLQTL